MGVGIDAHKRKCTTAMFEGDSAIGSFDFPTTRQGVATFMEKVPEGSTVVIESSTTGKTLSRQLLSKYDVHMVAPPERKASVKTDRRDAERIAIEDKLNYLRRCYMPSQYIEDLRFMVTQQILTGRSISGVKNRVHALLEKNMVQNELEGLTDIFGVAGLKKLSKLQLPRQDMITLARYLRELEMYVSFHKQQETELARMASSDQDVKLLMTIPGINFFTALAIVSRIGNITRFPTKKHLCSYAGVVPSANNSGEHVSQHNHVKHGDAILKYALTCAVSGAVKASKNSTVKLFYQKMIKKGVALQKAEVAAARKMACIVWKVLSSKQPYVDEDKYLTERKTKRMSAKARRTLPDSVMPSVIPEIIENVVNDVNVLERYGEDFEELIAGREGLSNKNGLEYAT